ncbi:MAG TPA: S53 family peptidase [Candidatus Dormibacteraeota bacterium]
MRRGLLLALVLVAAAASACAPATQTSTSLGGAQRVMSLPSHPLLSIAIRDGHDLGPINGATVLRLTLGLRGRDPNGLEAALSAGAPLTPQQLSAFGPDPVAVVAVESLLGGAGLTPAWTPGAATMSVSGPAAAVERVFGVAIHNRVGPDGARFYAPAHPAAIPESLQTAVNAATGLDDYPSATSSADLFTTVGVTPDQMTSFYNVDPLRSAGLDGSGMTVVFPEIDRYDPAMLDAFANHFNLPPFNVQVARTNAGSPDKEQGEADLDLEIVHAIAPGAREVVYYSSADDVIDAEQQMYRDYPHGAIESSSVGECEAPGGQNRNDANVLGDLQKPAAAAGWSIFVATGDRGAYDCAPAGDFDNLAADLDASIPYVTAVGGSLVVLSSRGGYNREASWGEPIQQWGGGGGLSEYWQMPSWQRAPGVQSQYSSGARETPDVSNNADGLSGWQIYALGDINVIGGTSAASPFWAGCAALIDEDLKQKGLPLIGFANPALYTFAQDPPGLPQPPYHDITAGTDLYYPATEGYDLATGLGTADIAALMSDFEWYKRPH